MKYYDRNLDATYMYVARNTKQNIPRILEGGSGCVLRIHVYMYL